MPAHAHRHRLGFVFTAILLGVAVASFVGLQATVHDLDRSLDAFYTRTQFADMTVVGGDAPAIAAAARDVPGVAAVNVRNTTTLSVFLRNGRTKVEGTIIGIPATGPQLNVPVVTDGNAFPRASTTPVAVVEQHTAEDLHLKPGDTVEALGTGDQVKLRITGVGLSPEYLLPAQSQQQVVSAPGSFAVVFVPDALVRSLGGAAAIPETLVRYAPDVDRGRVDRRLRHLAVARDASLVEPLDQQPSNGLIAEVQTGFEEASIVIPALALIVALFVGALACARVTDRRRRRRTAQVATIVGALGGALVGYLLARVAGPILTDAIHVPDHLASSNIRAVLIGVALALLAGLLAYASGTLLAGARTEDATLGAGPAFATAVAAAAAVMCVVAPVGVVDSAQATLVAAAQLERVDAQVAFAVKVQDQQLRLLTGVPGVSAAEPVPSANVVVSHGRSRYVTSLEAFRPNTTMQTFEKPNGAPLRLPRTGVLISEALGGMLHAAPGDELEITLPGAGVAPLRVPVAALTSDTLGNLVFLRIDTLRTAMGADASSFAGGLFNTATVRFSPGGDPRVIARRIQALPAVVVYVPVAAALNSVAAARPTFQTITDALLIIGVIVMVLGLSAAVVLHVRTRGRRGTRRLVFEVFAAVAVGAVVGALVGTFAADRLVAALDSDLIHLTRDIDRSTYGFALAMAFLVSAVVLVIGLLTLPKAAPSSE